MLPVEQGLWAFAHHPYRQMLGVQSLISQGQAVQNQPESEAFWPFAPPHGNVICNQPAVVGELLFRYSE